MKKTLFLLFVFCALGVRCQTLSYEVFVFEKKIGQAQISRHSQADTVTYILSSATNSSFFFTTRRTQQYFVVVYKAGHLIKADAISKVNDETNTTHIVWNGTGYSIKRNGKNFTVTGIINYSTLPMYWREPAAEEKIFSERMGEFFSPKKNESGSYEYTLSDGVKNIFTYQKGVPALIEMKKSFVTVQLRLTKAG